MHRKHSPKKTCPNQATFQHSRLRFCNTSKNNHFRWIPFRRSASKNKQSAHQNSEDKKFFDALVKPKVRAKESCISHCSFTANLFPHLTRFLQTFAFQPEKGHLESEKNDEFMSESVFRSLPVYRVSSSFRLLTEQYHSAFSSAFNPCHGTFFLYFSAVHNLQVDTPERLKTPETSISKSNRPFFMQTKNHAKVNQTVHFS